MSGRSVRIYGNTKRLLRKPRHKEFSFLLTSNHILSIINHHHPQNPLIVLIMYLFEDGHIPS